MKVLVQTLISRVSPVAALLLLAPLASQAQGKMSFGARLGGNLSKSTINLLSDVGQVSTPNLSFDYTQSYVLGAQGGVVLNMQWGQWAFQPALLFSQKGVKQKLDLTVQDDGFRISGDVSITTRVNYLELPLLAVYSTGSEGTGFQVFAGPYLAVGVGGQNTNDLKVAVSDPSNPKDSFTFYQNKAVELTFGDEFTEPNNNVGGGIDGLLDTGILDTFATTRRFDAGVTAGIGYRTGPVQVQLGYSLGLLNTQPSYPANFGLDSEKSYNRAVQLSATFFFGPK